MRIVLVGGVLALTWGASVASAGGINLAWNDCYGGGGATNRSFACDTNVGSNDLYLSIDPPVSVPDVVFYYATIDLQSASTTMPAWWQFKNVGSCRVGSLIPLNGPPGSCQNQWVGHATASLLAYVVTATLPSMPQNRSRILYTLGVGDPSAAEATAGLEYFAGLIRINNALTVGNPCAGCQDPVCLVLNQILFYTLNSGDFFVTNPLASNFVTWQGGAVGGAGCPAATPALNRTWGQLKSIYR